MILITDQGHKKELHKPYGNFQNTNTLFKVNYTTSKNRDTSSKPQNPFTINS